MLPWENTEGPLGRDRYLEVFMEEMTSMLRAGKVRRREKGDRGRKDSMCKSFDMSMALLGNGKTTEQD